VKKCDIIERLMVILGEDNIKTDEPMKNHTSFKVGGPADILVKPQNELQIKDVLKLCHDCEYPVFVMGARQ
jgi:UDP-N-acetylmuramate dehydrogenase